MTNLRRADLQDAFVKPVQKSNRKTKLWTRQFLSVILLSSATSTWAGNLFFLPNGDELAPLAMFQECAECPEMIVMPPGSFMMGAKPEESRNPFDFYGEGATGGVRGPDELNIIPSEHPRHPVEMNIPYAIGRNEVTHAEWMVCVADGGCSHDPDHTVLTFEEGYVPLGPNHPVINVSYLDVQEYVAWLNGLIGTAAYRLPTEAEWEYAARAGTETRFAQGDDLTSDQANFSRRGTENLRQLDRPEGMPELLYRDRPLPVDALDASNEWGLRHMSGNVGEWTRSCWTPEHLGLPSASEYLQHSQSQTACRRVEKGGSFRAGMDLSRPSWRARPEEARRLNYVGFRLIRELEKD